MVLQRDANSTIIGYGNGTIRMTIVQTSENFTVQANPGEVLTIINVLIMKAFYYLSSSKTCKRSLHFHF